MIWFLTAAGAVVLLLLGHLYYSGTIGLLGGCIPLSIGTSAANTTTSSALKDVRVMHAQVYAALAAPFALFLATYAILRWRKLDTDSMHKDVEELLRAQSPDAEAATPNHEWDNMSKDAEEAPREQRPEAESAAPNRERGTSAAVGDIMSTASSSSGFDDGLNGDAQGASPAGGIPQGSVREAASLTSVMPRRSNVSSPITPTSSSTSPTLPSGVARIGTAGISTRPHSLPGRMDSTRNGGDLFGKLLPACRQRAPVKFSHLFNNIEADQFKKIYEGKNSEVFRVFSYKGDSVLKVQQLDRTPESLDRVLSKIKITSRLTELKKMQDYSTAGFVELRSITCLFDAYPEELLLARKSDAGSTVQERRQGQAQRAYIAWHMSYAGVPLDQIELDSALQLWSILQQVTLSLVVAEKALEFEHRALRMGHVLVKRTNERSLHFSVGGRSFVVNTSGVEAHVTGYASARITDGGSPVFTVLEGFPDDSSDHNLLCVNRHMSGIIRNDWHYFHPLTNLLWVRHLTRELYRRYKPKFRGVAARYEGLAWSEIGSWREQLLDYCSLGDFVEAHFRADPLR